MSIKRMTGARLVNDRNVQQAPATPLRTKGLESRMASARYQRSSRRPALGPENSTTAETYTIRRIECLLKFSCGIAIRGRQYTCQYEGGAKAFLMRRSPKIFGDEPLATAPECTYRGLLGRS